MYDRNCLNMMMTGSCPLLDILVCFLVAEGPGHWILFKAPKMTYGKVRITSLKPFTAFAGGTGGMAQLSLAIKLKR